MSSWLDTAAEIALAPHHRLTARQRQCLALAARGLSSRAIAEDLLLSSRTVDEHILRACMTLGVRTRVQAVAILAAASRGAKGDSSPTPRDRTQPVCGSLVQPRSGGLGLN
ncbi:Spore germination protein GerE [compost metagenome]